MSDLAGLRAVGTGGASGSAAGTALPVAGGMSGLRLRPATWTP